MDTYKSIDDLDLKSNRALVRLDLNVPVNDGAVTDTTRIDRSIGTIKDLSAAGAKVILVSHFGRPKGAPNPDLSLRQVLSALEGALGQHVAFAEDCIGEAASSAVDAMADGDVLLLENTRFHKGEEANDPVFVEALASLADLFVNDAFSVSHRAHATSAGLAEKLPCAAGRALEAEVEALETVLGAPQRPVTAIVGGAKVSTKLELLSNLLDKVDYLVIGGGMANTFLAARGDPVGASLCEHELGDTARKIANDAKTKNVDLVLPTDVVVATALKPMAETQVIPVSDVGAKDMILDVGPNSLIEIAARLEASRTVLWNGPLGAFETPPFDNGTNQAARHVGMLTKIGQTVSVAGGGDTVAALANAGAEDEFTYVSTAGGAFLEWLEGKELPGLKALKKSG
jgi:phosphoglycerate kinase